MSYGANTKEYWIEHPEARLKKSADSKEYWNDPKSRQEMSAKIKAWWANHKDAKHSIGEIIKERGLTPFKGRHPTVEVRAQMSASQKGKHLSEETKTKLSAALKGRPRSEETKLKLSVALRGNHNPLGHKHTEEARAKMTLAQMGNKKGLGNKSHSGLECSPEAKAKLRITSTGRHHTEETKAKLSASHLGKHPSEKTRRKQSEIAKLAFLEGRRKIHYAKWASTRRGIKVRSPWEAKVCDILTDFGIAWDYEPQAFDMGKLGVYIPDLYLPAFDKWIEVKGWWKKNAKAKYKKFAKTHKALLIEKRQYDVITKYPHILKDWIEGDVKPLKNHTWQYKLV